MMRLRDIPEGVRLVSPDTPEAEVDGVDWFDEDGADVRVFFADGSIRNGSGLQELELDGDVATAVVPLQWGPQRWDERAEDAWDTYVAGDEPGVLRALAAVEDVEFTGDYNIWTFVESGLTLKALIAQRHGREAEVMVLTARLDVEQRSKHPEIARRALERGFDEELPDDPHARLRESARRWARSGSVGRDGAEYLAVHDATLGEIRRIDGAAD